MQTAVESGTDFTPLVQAEFTITHFCYIKLSAQRCVDLINIFIKITEIAPHIIS